MHQRCLRGRPQYAVDHQVGEQPGLTVKPVQGTLQPRPGPRSAAVDARVDQLFGDSAANDDSIAGQYQGDDLLDGGDGGDYLEGGAAADILLGGSGDTQPAEVST